MTELQFHSYLVGAILVAAVLSFVALLWIAAPYGRHARPGWGPTMPARVGWIVMESPAVLLFASVFISGNNTTDIVPVVFLALWQFHYVYRTFVFPFRISVSGKRMPLVIVAMAILFNCVNAYVNARWISHLGDYPDDWLGSVPFAVGVGLFALGWSVNQYSDNVLIHLRRGENTGYKIPYGGLYRWISSPNYLGEILEWLGWAIATWSMAGAAFALFTAANLVPRALANHRWYRRQFSAYPPSRRALIPHLL